MDDQFVKVPRKRSSGFGNFIFNVLTLIVVLAIVAVGVAFATVFINPYASYNPFPPPTVPVRLGTPTATSTPAQPLPTAWTPTPTFTLAPTDTPIPTATDTPVSSPTNTPEPPPFALQPGNPVLIPNIANGRECEWMGVGGQVFNLENQPIANLGVHLEGELDGESVSLDAISGSAPDIGPSGYVFDLADEPIASEGDLWIQLNDGSGTPLSEQIFFDTSTECNENFVMINWRQVREQ
ncbi:MAG: hypothetical protein PVI81_07780 [Anaerolineales bacterium]|jgi:hypothetical protein